MAARDTARQLHVGQSSLGMLVGLTSLSQHYQYKDLTHAK